MPKKDKPFQWICGEWFMVTLTPSKKYISWWPDDGKYGGRVSLNKLYDFLENGSHKCTIHENCVVGWIDFPEKEYSVTKEEANKVKKIVRSVLRHLKLPTKRPA